MKSTISIRPQTHISPKKLQFQDLEVGDYFLTPDGELSRVRTYNTYYHVATGRGRHANQDMPAVRRVDVVITWSLREKS